MKVSKETIQALRNLGYHVWGDLKGFNFLEDDQDYEKATILVVAYVGEEDEWVKRLQAPKAKEVTVEWVLSKLNQDSSYKNLYEYLKSTFNSTNIYAASYGVGVDTLFDKEKEGERVAEKLKKLGLKYRTEYSDAGWVYRFIISKDKDNLKILQAIK